MLNQAHLIQLKIILLTIIIFFVIITKLQAETLTLNSTAESYDLAPYIDIFIDPEKKFNITEISSPELQKKFTLKINKKENLGYINGQIWLRFKLKNLNIEKKNWIIEFAFPAYDNMHLYMPTNNNNYQKITNDFSLKFAERAIPHRHFMFPLELENSNIKTFYISIDSKNIIALPIKIRSHKATINKIKNEYYSLGIYYGILIVMLLYNLCLFFSLKNYSYLFYSLFVGSFALFQMTMNSISFEYFWPDSPKFQYYFTAIAIVIMGFCAIIFIRSFLNSKHYTPQLDNSLLHLICFLPLILSSCLFLSGISTHNFPKIINITTNFFAPIIAYYSITFFHSNFKSKQNLYFIILISLIVNIALYALKIHFLIFNNLFFLALISISLLISIKAYYKGSRNAYYFLIAWGIFLLTAISLILLGLGILPANVITQNGLQIGSAFAITCLSFGLADNFKQERIAKEKAQILAIKNLEKTNKLKDDILSNVSHELRTPIAAILGLLDRVITDEKNLSKYSLNNLNLAVASSKQLNILINDILTTAELKNSKIKLNLTTLNLYKICNNIIEIFTPLAKHKNLKLINLCPRNIPAIIADENRLYQIFYNLLGNALKFTKTGSITIKTSQKNEKIYIAIIDTGIGIPSAQIEYIFNAFRQGNDHLTKEFPGNGLGLTIVKNLINLHNETITVTSTINKGTEFCFSLPISQEIRAINNKTPNIEGSIITVLNPNKILDSKKTGKKIIHKKPFTILVIDDDHIQNYIITELLENEFGYKTEQAANAEDSLNIIKNKKIDLILLDIMLPHISGFSLCEIIRREYSKQELPIIFLTAKQNKESLHKSLKYGANDYLTKPINKEELSLRIEYHLENIIAKKHFNSLQEFSKKITNFTHDKEILKLATEKISNANIISTALLFENNKLVYHKNLNNEHLKQPKNLTKIITKATSCKEYNVLKINNIQENSWILSHYITGKQTLLNSHFIFLQIKTLEEYIIILWRNKNLPPFTQTELDFTTRLIQKIYIFKESNKKLSLTPNILKTINEVSDILTNVIYIKSNSQYCEIYTSNKKAPILIRIAINHLDQYFPDKKLLRIHRSYLINPNYSKNLLKSGRDYKVNIIYQNKIITLPVGRNYSKKLHNHIAS
jgi:signal transduction histidine kinase/DNA-binding response OmpR family regulator